MHAIKSLKHWSSLSLALWSLYAILLPLSASAADLTISDSISPTTDHLMPFGSRGIDLGTTAEQIVTITNTGTDSKQLLTIRISGEGAADFTLILTSGETPCEITTPTIVSGGNCTVSIRFDPKTTGLRTAFLNLSFEEEKIAFHNGDGTNGISFYGITSGLLTHVDGLANDDYPSWSPNGTELIFHRDDAAYRMGIDSSNPTLLVERSNMPDWSPNGKKIIMRSTEFGGLKLFNLDQNLRPTELTGGLSGEHYSPDWSPDSQKIVFEKDPFSGSLIQITTNIFTINSDATSQNLIAKDGFTPAWSPDGQTIAFHDGTTNGISTAAAGGGVGTTVQLTHPLGGSKDSQPSWSPDGDRIVFRRAAGSGNNNIGDLIIIDVASETEFTIPNDIRGRTPAWGPASLSNITLTGTGLAPGGANNPPTAPILVSPQNGATGLGSNVVFKWLPASDPDGDPLTYKLLLCKTIDYDNDSCPTPTVVTKSGQQVTSFYPASGGLLLIGIVFFASQNRRKKQGLWLGGFLLVLGVLTLGACSGGGSSSTGGGETTLTTNRENLFPGTHYNWQIIANDGRGGETKSLVRTFSTKS